MLERRPFLFMDPPDHTRLRGLVNKAFTPRVVEELRPRIQAIVDELLDAALERGALDVIPRPRLPAAGARDRELLGVPPEDRERFSAWSRELARGARPRLRLAPTACCERRQHAIDEFTQYFRDLIALRRRDPRDDLISALIAAEEEGDKLTEDELLATLHPAAGRRPRDDDEPDRQRRARAAAPPRSRRALARATRRSSRPRRRGAAALRSARAVDRPHRARRTMRLPSGVTSRRASRRSLLLGAANRDPAQFPRPRAIRHRAHRQPPPRLRLRASTSAWARRSRASRARSRSPR